MFSPRDLLSVARQITAGMVRVQPCVYRHALLIELQGFSVVVVPLAYYYIQKHSQLATGLFFTLLKNFKQNIFICVNLF